MSEMPPEDAVISPGASARGKLKQRRSRKACQHCHTRKIRCNVLESGTPCSNCVDAGTTCIIRRRKNQRRDSTPPDVGGYQTVLDQTHTWRIPTGNSSSWTSSATPRPSIGSVPAESFGRRENPSLSSESPQNGEGRAWADMQPNLWEQAPVVDASSASCDFSHLTDLDDIFTFTGNSFLIPPTPQEFSFTPAYPQHTVSPPALLPPPPMNGHTNRNGSVAQRSMSTLHIPGLNPRDHDYLRGEGCFELPPASILRQMMHMYFRMVHPNLPIVAEDQHWAMWNGDEFNVGQYSFLLLRAMIFAATSYTELDMLSTIGFVSKREARNTHYRLAKLVYDFGLERDAIASAQTCLLLSYNAPNYNLLRLNTYWVTNAIRFAKIERANSYHRIKDPVRSKLLKRLWWGVIFRDRILSLGLRRSIQVDLDPDWEGEKHVLRAEDFQSELGHSLVHDVETQLRIVEMIGVTCRLMQCVSHASRILYRHERLDDRLEAASRSLPSTVSGIQQCLVSLRVWHDHSIRSFPFPISLDDAPETICVYANMMFSYHAAAVSGLNVYLILLHEVFPSGRTLFSLDEAKDGLEAANSDVSRRTQELVQVRLVKYLPISASAVLALPLTLQAINVAAARGSGMEAVEIRKLDVFTRTLKSQQQNFDGSDFCADILTNVTAYAQDDAKFVSSMMTWRDNKEGNDDSGAGANGQNKIKLNWGNLVHKRPRLFLRLVLYLDHAFSTGGPPMDDDFPVELQRGSA
ncbi:unnamed protein product [Zymoseptoria tritici ST99CH_3D1]|nr:unnamed protein product [Zymoseptoria tritici ST99CH_3D1]